MKTGNKTKGIHYVQLVMIQCHGPALEPDEEKCIESQVEGVVGWKKLGFHEIPKGGDGASYNGIRFWKCPTCFAEHRRRISIFKTPKVAHKTQKST